ncbi:calcium/proton exchanger [Kickxella alabastrina]|uniref:calcium/proton exchanger n=1 Tax=Kickxella alabastrina TaxID=61397 RepID=UPI0022204FC4|nr:calcium/proton exchanger [Kickxella alabastrina]KAI7824012.1 calcium/proton exchanger [Kickxella alabastrina]
MLLLSFHCSRFSDQPLLVLRRSLLNSWINVLLVLVPLGIASRSAMLPDVAIFLINFFAIIPLAKLLGYATEQLALHLGDTLGGLLNATFGNAIELILGILALVKGKIEIVQTSLVGSILSNLLLVGGCCLFLGGIKNNEQVFNIHAAQSYGTLLAMAILATLLPAAYNLLDAKGSELKRGTLILSHVTAVLLLIIYVAYLVFQLKTHSSLFAAVASLVDVDSNAEIEAKLIEAKLVEENEEEEEEIELTIWASVFLLAVSTALTGMCAEFLVSSIDGLTTKWNMSPSFVGMILLPIVGNAAEHATAVTVAIRNKMDLALGVAVGSSIQIALFVMPFLCILGWIIKEPMTIYFNPFTTIVMFVSVLLVNYVIGDGRTNWLEGLILLIAYFIIGVAYFLYPKELNS